MFHIRSLTTLLCCLAWACLCFAEGATSAGSSFPVPEEIQADGLHHVFRVDDELYSGSSPADEKAFRSLAQLGVKVIVSVDGSKPLVELARKHGMRYVHLPIGYDGLPANRVAELAKVATETTAPIYVHCHHGKHRGPAAVAGICRAVKNWSPQQARAWMKQAGTSEDYAGLYRDIEKLEKPDAAALARVPASLPEVAPTPGEVDAMVAIDDIFERVKAAQSAGWQTVPQHPDITPAQAATELWEHYRELARTPDTALKPASYRAQLGEAESLANDLRVILKVSAAAGAEKDAAFRKVSRSCAACHREHRN